MGSMQTEEWGAQSIQQSNMQWDRLTAKTFKFTPAFTPSLSQIISISRLTYSTDLKTNFRLIPLQKSQFQHKSLVTTIRLLPFNNNGRSGAVTLYWYNVAGKPAFSWIWSLDHWHTPTQQKHIPLPLWGKSSGGSWLASCSHPLHSLPHSSTHWRHLCLKPTWHGPYQSKEGDNRVESTHQFTLLT